jgi:hypothetical protein
MRQIINSRWIKVKVKVKKVEKIFKIKILKDNYNVSSLNKKIVKF